jgi:L-alanine-DL-glutamate epimerase-like enolase superfamily enzyme
MSAVIRLASADLVEFRLDRPVGGSGVAVVDVIVVRVSDADGASGVGFSYVLGGGGGSVAAIAREQLTNFVLNKPLVHPKDTWRRINKSFNRTGLGPNTIALAAVDVALWDLYARKLGVPLAVAVGGAPRPVPVYGSGGYNTAQCAQEAAEVASAHIGRGLKGVKPRVSGAPRDRTVIAEVAKTVAGSAHVMVDANEKCDLISARALVETARHYGVLFVEEPIPSSDLRGFRSLAASAGVSIACGEHFQDTRHLADLMADRVVSIVQPDLAMIGGLTPVLDLSTVAGELGAVVSPHFLPGLFVHLAAACPSMTWLEEFPLLEPLFDGWPEISGDGTMIAGSSVGHGLQLSEKALSLLKQSG